MKRSEMIRIIANLVYELNVDSNECNYEADRILKALEEAGMLAPFNHCDSERGLSQIEFSRVMWDSGFDDYTTSWESEEEDNGKN